jgi:hypothetical protein
LAQQLQKEAVCLQNEDMLVYLMYKAQSEYQANVWTTSII